MKKTTVSFLILIISALLLVPLLSSCDFFDDLAKNLGDFLDYGKSVRSVASSAVGEQTHKFNYSFDEAEHWGFCEDCGVMSFREPHAFVSEESVAATCENIGYDISKCSICKYEKTVFEPQNAHEFQIVDGSDLRECVNCHRKEGPLTEIPESERYGYTYLSSLENSETYLRIYKKLSAAAAVAKDKLELKELITTDELSTIYYCFVKDHPEYFWLANNKYQYTIDGKKIDTLELLYYLHGDHLSEAKVAFNRAADEILSGVLSSMTDFEKELYIHDTIVKKNIYDETTGAPMTHSAYGALVYNYSVCDGYSNLFSYLLTRCGVQSAVIWGYSLGSGHAWNAVKLDGEWYMVDPTWDDPLGNEPDEVSHTYFNCSWDEFSVNHSFEDSAGEKFDNYYDIPECNSEKYNYFSYFGYEGELKTADIEKVVRLQFKKGQTENFQIRINGITGTSDEKKEKIESFVARDPELKSVLARVLGKSSWSIISYSVSDDGSILKLSLK